jgi:hypothetical protein
VRMGVVTGQVRLTNSRLELSGLVPVTQLQSAHRGTAGICGCFFHDLYDFQKHWPTSMTCCALRIQGY